MITRRKVVLGMSAAVVGSAVLPAAGLAELLETGSATAGSTSCGANASGSAGAEAVENRLSRDLARMAFRADSEEGVPVLLACLNQVVDPATGKSAPARVTAFNSSVVSEMRQITPAWEQLRPNCRVSEVARVIQVVAARDFAAGGTERRA